MNIIVEGIDKAGKSTIANDIRESLYPTIPITLKLSRKPQDGSFFEQNIVGVIYSEIFAEVNNVLNDKHIFLFDRAYPSEMVYSVKRGYDAMKSETFVDLDYRLGQENKTLLVYCEATPEVIAKRFKADREEYLTEADIAKTLERYEEFLAMTSLPFIRINSLTDRGANIVAVREFLKL